MPMMIKGNTLAIIDGEAQSVHSVEMEQLALPVDEVDAVRSRRLWLCVIRQAIHDFVATKGSDRVEKRKLHFEVKRWLFGEDDLTLSNSYASLCLELGIPPGWGRELALNMDPKKVWRVEMLGRRKRGGV
jgi:hypothetical protein